VLDVELGILGHDPGAEIAGLAHAAGSCVIARGALGHGLLEGKYTPQTTFAPGDPRADLGPEWLADGLRRVEQLGFLHAEGRPWSLGQAALQWVLARPGVASVVVPMHGEEQLREFAGAVGLPPLPDDDLARIEALIECDFAPLPEPAAGDEATDEPTGEPAQEPVSAAA
jgi:aryl-alcohol dehydrogenase-like predicted oxidoreductase